mgnify:CR=1 FL=1
MTKTYYYFYDLNEVLIDRYPAEIANKIKSYSHGEFNTKDNTNEEMISQKIIENKDIFDRGFKLKKIVIDRSLPDYIVNNKEYLKNWII